MGLFITLASGPSTSAWFTAGTWEILYKRAGLEPAPSPLTNSHKPEPGHGCTGGTWAPCSSQPVPSLGKWIQHLLPQPEWSDILRSTLDFRFPISLFKAFFVRAEKNQPNLKLREGIDWFIKLRWPEVEQAPDMTRTQSRGRMLSPTHVSLIFSYWKAGSPCLGNGRGRGGHGLRQLQVYIIPARHPGKRDSLSLCPFIQSHRWVPMAPCSGDVPA